MSDYIGGGLALAAIVAMILGVLFFGGQGGETSIVSEAHAGVFTELDYGWKTGMSPTADAHGQAAEFY